MGSATYKRELVAPVFKLSEFERPNAMFAASLGLLPGLTVASRQGMVSLLLDGDAKESHNPHARLGNQNVAQLEMQWTWMCM